MIHTCNAYLHAERMILAAHQESRPISSSTSVTTASRTHEQVKAGTKLPPQETHEWLRLRKFNFKKRRSEAFFVNHHTHFVKIQAGVMTIFHSPDSVHTMSIDTLCSTLAMDIASCQYLKVPPDPPPPVVLTEIPDTHRGSVCQHLSTLFA